MNLLARLERVERQVAQARQEPEARRSEQGVRLYLADPKWCHLASELIGLVAGTQGATEAEYLSCKAALDARQAELDAGGGACESTLTT